MFAFSVDILDSQGIHIDHKLNYSNDWLYVFKIADQKTDKFRFCYLLFHNYQVKVILCILYPNLRPYIFFCNELIPLLTHEVGQPWLKEMISQMLIIQFDKGVNSVAVLKIIITVSFSFEVKDRVFL